MQWSYDKWTLPHKFLSVVKSPKTAAICALKALSPVLPTPTPPPTLVKPYLVTSHLSSQRPNDLAVVESQAGTAASCNSHRLQQPPAATAAGCNSHRLQQPRITNAKTFVLSQYSMCSGLWPLVLRSNGSELVLHVSDCTMRGTTFDTKKLDLASTSHLQLNVTFS